MTMNIISFLIERKYKKIKKIGNLKNILLLIETE